MDLYIRTQVSEQNRLESLQEEKDELGTYRAVAEKYGVSAALVWRMLVQGQLPHSNALRKRLRLPMRADIITKARCECGNKFTPNVPWRKRCYICSPAHYKPADNSGGS